MSAPARDQQVASGPAIPAGLAEACWLSALILVPLVHNPHSLQSFQPNKVLFLRLLAAVLVGLGLAAWIERGKFALHVSATFRSVRGQPLVIALISYAAACAVSTLLSINPALSFFGGPEHRLGLLTLVSGIVLLAAIATGLRREHQIDRFVTATIAVSLPVALYAIAQRLGRDSLFTNIFDGRSMSTLGHPIYLAGYLQMVFPLTLWRAWHQWGERRLSDKGRGSLSWPFVGLILVGLVQLAGFVSAESRGPLLALGTTLTFFAVTVSAYRRKWRFFKGVVVVGILSVVSLVALNLPHPAMERLSESLRIKRFAEILPMKSGPDAFRTEIWKQAPKVMLSKEPLPFPVGGSDSFHRLRPWIGYGMETMPAVLARHYTLPWATAPLENRFHNLVWDSWISVGIIGLAAFLAFMQLLFFKGFQRLGWMREARSRFLFWGLSIFGALTGAATLWLWGGPGFGGLGLIAGLVGGITAFPLISAVTGMGPSDEREGGSPARHEMLILAVLSALAGHLVDASFAFVTTGTFTLFFAYGGLLMALFAMKVSPIGDDGPSRLPKSQTPPSPAQAASVRSLSEPRRPLLWRIFVCSALSSVVLVTLAFSFLHLVSKGDVSPGTVLYASLTKAAGYHASSFALLMIFIPTWLGVNFLFAREGASDGCGSEVGRTLGAALAISAIVVGLYSWLLAAQIAGVGPLPRLDDDAAVALTRCIAYERIAVTFVWLALALIGVTGLALSGWTRWRWRPFILRTACVGAMVGGLWHLVANGLRADVAARWGDTLLNSGNSAQSAAVFGRSATLNPEIPTYHRLLAHALAALYEESSDETFIKVIGKAETSLLEARRRTRGLDPAIFELGFLYTYWAGRETNLERQLDLAGKAAKSLEEARTFQPGKAITWTQSAIVHSIFLRRTEEAASKSRRAADLIRLQDPHVWADYYRDLCLAVTDPRIKRAYAERALERYAVIIASEPAESKRVALSHRGVATLHVALDEEDAALASYLKCLKGPPDGETWRDESMVAQIFYQKQRFVEALAHLDAADRHAPPDRKASITELQALTRLQIPSGSH